MGRDAGVARAAVDVAGAGLGAGPTAAAGGRRAARARSAASAGQSGAAAGTAPSTAAAPAAAADRATGAGDAAGGRRAAGANRAAGAGASRLLKHDRAGDGRVRALGHDRQRAARGAVGVLRIAAVQGDDVVRRRVAAVGRRRGRHHTHRSGLVHAARAIAPAAGDVRAAERLVAEHHQQARGAAAGDRRRRDHQARRCQRELFSAGRRRLVRVRSVGVGRPGSGHREVARDRRGRAAGAVQRQVEGARDLQTGRHHRPHAGGAAAAGRRAGTGWTGAAGACSRAAAGARRSAAAGLAACAGSVAGAGAAGQTKTHAGGQREQREASSTHVTYLSAGSSPFTENCSSAARSNLRRRSKPTITAAAAG